ncbi:MAG: hypothetical protein LQ350_006697 [Teloschistes chrysophthalmus]|nr:MAG: hypothetical protein LQ350_006697 [Niorma chrysophthalma]
MSFEASLIHQRDGLAQSSAVDANALADKLKYVLSSRTPITVLYAELLVLYSQIERSCSASPARSPTPPYTVGQQQEDEKRDYEALLKEKGRPCYPIELGFLVFDNPGQYKDILEYWQHPFSLNKRVFGKQLYEWHEFQRRRQRWRRSYVRRNRFHEYRELTREIRRRHGFGGDVHPREELAEQSKLDDWGEYQAYKLWEHEWSEQKLKEIREKLASARKALTEEGYSAFEKIEELDFGEHEDMMGEWAQKHRIAKEQLYLAERKLEIAKHRLEAAQSEELGERVERDRWIGWFEKEVGSQRTRLDELQRLLDKLTPEYELISDWFGEHCRPGCGYGHTRGMTEDGKHFSDLEKVEIKERYSQALDARKATKHARFEVEQKVKLAEELVEAARTEDLAEIVERAALINRTQKAVRFAEFHVEEEKESTRVPHLPKDVISHLYGISCRKRDLRRHKAVLGWIEQQRLELVRDCVGIGRENRPGRPTRASSRALRSSLAREASNVDYSAEERARPRKPTAKSILDPVDPAKVTKPSNKRRSPRQRKDVPRGVLQAAETTIIGPGPPTEPGSKVAGPAKDGIRSRLRSSRVSKPVSKTPIGQPKGDTKLLPPRSTHRRTRKPLAGALTLSRKVVGFAT